MDFSFSTMKTKWKQILLVRITKKVEEIRSSTYFLEEVSCHSVEVVSVKKKHMLHFLREMSERVQRVKKIIVHWRSVQVNMEGERRVKA